jgi:hypothetical protein
MPMASAMAQALGNLIQDLNPYAGLTQLAKSLSTGDMDIYFGNPAPTMPPSGTVDQIHMEVDGRYPGEWNFKGQPQKINKAVRIKYRVPVKDANGNVLYWVDEYLLIGYEGSNCGG